MQTLELWIDQEYARDVDASPYRAVYEDEHECYRVTIPVEDEESWLASGWAEIASFHGFQPESVIYCF